MRSLAQSKDLFLNEPRPRPSSLLISCSTAPPCSRCPSSVPPAWLRLDHPVRQSHHNRHPSPLGGGCRKADRGGLPALPRPPPPVFPRPPTPFESGVPLPSRPTIPRSHLARMEAGPPRHPIAIRLPTDRPAPRRISAKEDVLSLPSGGTGNFGHPIFSSCSDWTPDLAANRAAPDP